MILQTMLNRDVIVLISKETVVYFSETRATSSSLQFVKVILQFSSTTKKLKLTFTPKNPNILP